MKICPTSTYCGSSFRLVFLLISIHVQDIYLAREDGSLELEEEVYRELIELYRSPERMILKTIPPVPRFTAPNPEPKAKEKEE